MRREKEIEMSNQTNEPIFQQGGIKRLLAYLIPLAIFFALAFHFTQSL